MLEIAYILSFFQAQDPELCY